MNLTAYYKSKLILIFCILAAPAFGKLLKPTENGENKEILIVSSKRRLYYNVDQEGLVYSVMGPTRLELISRYPSAKRTKDRVRFNYSIVVDETDTINVHHRYKIQKSIKSIQHPNHSYTYSGNYFINLDSGQHSIKLFSSKKQEYPVLMRVLGKEFEKPKGNSKILTPLVYQPAKHVKVESSEVEYFEGTSQFPLQITSAGPKTVRVYSRLEFDDWMGEQEAYRIRVQSGKKVVGTYYFSTERSSEAVVVENPTKVPGKWRTCEFEIPTGENTFTIEIVESDRKVLMRFLEF